jgi:hypothetical protein
MQYRVQVQSYRVSSYNNAQKNTAWAWSCAPIAAGNVRTCTGVNNGITLNLSKFFFLQTRITYLAYEISYN